MERIVECLPFAAGGRDFLLVIPSTAVFEVDAEVAAWVREARAHPDAPPPQDLVEPLRALGLLVADGAPPGRLADPVPLDEPLATLVLHLTRRCPTSCVYCYGRRDAAGPDEMSPAVARRAVDFLFDQAGSEGPLGFTFFGGEPLHNLPALRAAAQRARQRAGDGGRPVRFAITTGAIPLSAGAVDLLARFGVQVTVSLDGPRAVHDDHRPYPDGRGSYDDAVAGLRRLTARVEVHGRATVTRLHPDPEPVIDHLLALGMASAGISTADVPPGPLALDDGAYERLTAGMERLADRYLDAARSGDHLRFSNLDGLLRSLHRGINRDLPCGAGVRLAACDTDGRLYLCHRLTSDPEHALGSITDGLVADRPARLRALSLDERPGCSDCWARYICGGGCHHARAVAAAAGREQPDACRWLRHWYCKGLEVYATLASEQPQLLDKWFDPPPPGAVQ